MTVSTSRLLVLSNAVRALANDLADKRNDEMVAEIFEAADFLQSCAGAGDTVVAEAGEPKECKASAPVQSLMPYASAEKLREWIKALDTGKIYGLQPTPAAAVVAEMRAVVDRAEVERMRDALLALEGALGEGGLYDNGALCRVAREGLGKPVTDVTYDGPAVLQFRYTTIEHSGKFGPGAVVLHFSNLPRAEAANAWLLDAAGRILNRKAAAKGSQDRAP